MYYGTNMVLDMALKSGKCRKVGRCFQYFHLQKTIPKKQPRVEYGKTSTSFPVRIDLKKRIFMDFLECGWVFWMIPTLLMLSWWLVWPLFRYLPWTTVKRMGNLAGKVDFMADWISKMEAVCGGCNFMVKNRWCRGRKVKELRNYHGNWPQKSFQK